MRAPEGNNGNLKNNWRKDISSFSRKSFNNIPQAGYPKFVPDAGNDPDKVFRPWRFYRHEIRQVVQEAAQKSKGIEALDKTQANLEIDLTEARAKAALAVGTDYESETSEEVARLERTLEAVVGIQAERQAEEAELLAQVEEKKELLRQIVVARYQS